MALRYLWIDPYLIFSTVLPHRTSNAMCTVWHCFTFTIASVKLRAWNVEALHQRFEFPTLFSRENQISEQSLKNFRFQTQLDSKGWNHNLILNPIFIFHGLLLAVLGRESNREWNLVQCFRFVSFSVGKNLEFRMSILELKRDGDSEHE